MSKSKATTDGALQPSSGRLRRLRGDRGQGIVEFALILPVFMLLILGMIDFGSAYNTHNDMTQLAGEAVRFAAVNSCGGAPCAGGSIVTQVQSDADNNCLANGGSDCGGATGPQQQLSVCFWYPNGPGPGRPVTAVVKTRFRWLPFIGLGTDIPLSAKATMRIEQPLTGTSSDVYTPDAGDCSS